MSSNGTSSRDSETEIASRTSNPNSRTPPSAYPPVTNMSTTALEHKLKTLREQSNQHSQLLTQKLASSQSGQDLLHIGTSLSTLPPDLHSLLTSLHPVLSATEQLEKATLANLEKLVVQVNQIRLETRRSQHAQSLADLYADLVAAERIVATHSRRSKAASYGPTNTNSEEDMDSEDEVSQAAALERAAHVTLCLVEELHSATDTVSSMTQKTKEHTDPAKQALPSLRTPLPPNQEGASFLLQLAPRIRRVESETVTCLSHQMESVLQTLQEQQSNHTYEKGDHDQEDRSQDTILLRLGHCMRGLALLSRGKEVESIFARVAIMPLIRSRVSMGRLDDGGARGECAGLQSLLDEMIASIARVYGPVLNMAESMFRVEDTQWMDVDLLTCGVWIPIATALMADAGIKMAIFSPGIASILQANYVTLDRFLATLSKRLLTEISATSTKETDLRYQPCLTPQRIEQAQNRIYAHAKTAEFSKKWNLPIYYQLRFGECCSRLNKAIDQTRREGWITDVYTGTPETLLRLRNESGFELSLFLELADVLLFLWRPNVILQPLTNRFLRGAVQLIGRTVSFIGDSMDGQIKFGEELVEAEPSSANGEANGGTPPMTHPTRRLYCWGESEQDVAAVAWELTILESMIQHDYVDTICGATTGGEAVLTDTEEGSQLVSEVLNEASGQIKTLVDKAWNESIVSILTTKCCGPLAAVKGVAATYRMTNRPPPTQASPFVSTILRPLNEFNIEFLNRTPDKIGLRWKQRIVVSVSDRYAAAVEELIATVQRTEVALQNRGTRRRAAGGMSDGEKVKLQLLLDYQTYCLSAKDVGVEPDTVIGISKLRDLTLEGEKLFHQSQNGS